MTTKRCPDCDRDGEVLNNNGVGYMTCPRCDGTRKIQEVEQPMNEEALYRWLMISAAVLAAMCGLGAVALVVLSAIEFSWGVLLCSMLLTGGAIGCGYVTVLFSSKTTVPKVFNNQDEREVLTLKQRKIIRRARGDVVLEKALIEVEHERQNIVHKQIEAAHDPNRPPHHTRWSDEAWANDRPHLLPPPDDRREK